MKSTRAARLARRTQRFLRRNGILVQLPAWPHSADRRPKVYRAKRVIADYWDFRRIALQQIFSFLSQRRPEWTLFHWRSANGNEVDFVIEKPDGAITALCVYADTPRNRMHVRGFIAFSKKHPEAICIALAPAQPQALFLDSILVLSITQYLKNLNLLSL